MNIAVNAVSAKDARWYVVHAYSGHEEKVRANLLKRVESMDMHDQIFDVLVPTEEVMEIKDGQRRKVLKRIFPGYILVNMVMSDEFVVRGPQYPGSHLVRRLGEQAGSLAGARDSWHPEAGEG